MTITHRNEPDVDGSVSTRTVTTGVENTGREGLDQRVIRLVLRIGW